MSRELAIEINLDPVFLKACVDASNAAASAGTVSSSDDTLGSPTSLLYSPTSTIFSPTTLTAAKAMPRSDDEHLSDLLANYSAAVTDFYGSGLLCIYKTGPAWPVNQGPQSQKIKRAIRPIHNHPITPKWRLTAWSIAALLESGQVDWNTIDPCAYANKGQAGLICEFVISVSVKPQSLDFAAALAAADAINVRLNEAGFPNIQVAFVESVYRRQGKLMGFNPTYDAEGLPGLKKPFTPTLGIPIAPKNTPYYEGTGGLFIRLNTSESDNRLGLLTCAHVAHPLPVSKNVTYPRKFDSQPREDFVLLGTAASDKAVAEIMKFIGDQTKSIGTWENALEKIPAQVEGELRGITLKRNELTGLIAAAKEKIKQADEHHSFVTKNFSTVASRSLGSVLHVAEIKKGEDGFVYDWAMLLVDEDKIDKDTFKANKLFIGGNKTSVDWQNMMFSQLDDSRDFHIPDDMLLTIKGFVTEAEFRSPKDRDIHNLETLLAVKNGRTTHTTYGRVNGLESITRTYPEYGVEVKAFEFIVCGYDTKTGENDQFSDEGDSGAIVVGRDGRIIGMLTGGGGPTTKTDKTYVTPWYALLDQIKEVYPNFYVLVEA